MVSSTDPSIILKQALERLAQLAELEPDRDSYGAHAPTPEAVGAARELLIEVGERLGHRLDGRVMPSAVVPLADGGVQIEWRGTTTDLELEIRAANEFAYLVVDRSGTETTFDEADNVSWSVALDLVTRTLLT
jgi:hypothetical protein